MDLTRWPFSDSCPRELSPGPQSKIPAWASVGLDIPQEELAAFLRSQTEAKPPALAQVVDLLSSPVWALLLAVTFVAVAVYDAYRSFRRRKVSRLRPCLLIVVCLSLCVVLSSFVIGYR